MIKRILLLVSIIIFFTFASKAQIDLPYSTTWETTAGQDEWTQYRLFNSSLFDWGFSGFGSLTHDYPVGNTQGDTIRDWMVSPALNFFSPSKLSFSANTFTFAGLQDMDYFGIWFSSGSKDPSDGDYQEIIDLTTYSPGGNWKDTSGVELPFTAAEGYIAIVYIESTNWFTVGIDSLVVTPDNLMSNSDIISNDDINIYPTLIADFATLEVDENLKFQNLKLLIYNNLGQHVLCQDITQYQTSINFSDLPQGHYYYQILENDKLLKVGKVLLQ